MLLPKLMHLHQPLSNFLTIKVDMGCKSCGKKEKKVVAIKVLPKNIKDVIKELKEQRKIQNRCESCD